MRGRLRTIKRPGEEKTVGKDWVGNEGKEETKLGRRSIATADVQGVDGYSPGDGHFTSSRGEFGFGGTSAAVAQVAGVVALMLSANPDLGSHEVREILCATAKTAKLRAEDGKEPVANSDEFGAGLVDAAAAVKGARYGVGAEEAA